MAILTIESIWYSKKLKKLCYLYDFNDIWHVLNPEAEEFTWRNNSFKIQRRLDYFLISKKLNDLTDKCKILYAPEMDHSAILIHIKSEELKHKRGPGLWKFNPARFLRTRLTLPCCVQKYLIFD